MQVIGLNFTKISSEKNSSSLVNPTIDIKFEFPSIKEEEISLLKDSKALKINFRHAFSYYESKKENSEKNKSSPLAKIEFEGDLLLALPEADHKEALKSWKKKEISSLMRDFLTNVLARKCLSQAIPLINELSLPHPFLRIPQFSTQPTPEKS